MAEQTLWDTPIQDKASIQTLEEGLAFFVSIGMPARNLSEETREVYQADLEDLIDFLKRRGIHLVRQVGLQSLLAYQAEMDKRGYQDSTREHKTYAIKHFFGFLAHNQVITHNPATRLIPPRVAKKDPRYLSADEYRRLRLAASHHARDAAIIEVFLQTGMRLSELAGLTMYDIDIPERITRDDDGGGTVRVKRKGGSIDTLPLNYRACEALSTYLRVRPDVDTPELWISRNRRQLTARQIQKLVRKYLDKVGIQDGSPRTLRHTYGTHHALKGTDLKVIQENMDITSATLYPKLAGKEQRRASQRNALD
jgi:site-specific recombinase XerD